ncbi:MAG: hypothetical protein ACLR3C_12810 [Eggerthella lenta]
MNSGRTLQQRFPPSYTSSATSDTNRDPSSARAVCTTTSKALATFDSMTSTGRCRVAYHRREARHHVGRRVRV